MAKNVLEEIKKDLDSYVGERVTLKANRGRRKILQKEGILEQTYPNIFIIKVDEDRGPRRISYSYADILTETVEIKIKNKNTKIGSISV
ncbi:Veg protein [Anoxybacter fermentans]|uniref:Veg protein n=1 Tax=Anoxybacter fermentans TaxID=1323375 RepID=A0A3S9T1Z5_9FIRM|nr:Veg family protein [Anoxybacter fermentans]AZR74442.1 Veg protein [Anoxybacter fermentans]